MKKYMYQLSKVVKTVLEGRGYYNLSFQKDEKGLYISGKGTYYARRDIRALGGEWDAETRAWFVGWTECATILKAYIDGQNAPVSEVESTPAPEVDTSWEEWVMENCVA